MLIWAYFRPEFEMITKEIPEIEIINGSVSNKKAEERIQNFKKGKLKYLLAHPASMSYGLTFTNCRYSIWYSLDWSEEQHYQAVRRIYRAGQTHTTHHYYLIAYGLNGEETIDSLIQRKLKGKYEDQIALLNAIITQYEGSDTN